MFSAVDPNSRANRWGARFGAAALTAALVMGLVWIMQMTQMPLESFGGPLPPLSNEQAVLRDRLAKDVKILSVDLGERSTAKPGSLQAAAAYIEAELQREGYPAVEYTYLIGSQKVSNIQATLTGSDEKAGEIVVGAHYDSVAGTVGANDNATGVAATLELARQLRGSRLHHTVRFLFFVNEEPPFFQTEEMGSLVYAEETRRKDVNVAAMISLETIGYYSDAPRSQKYPPILGLFYPTRGNFIGFVGTPESRDLVRRCVRDFRKNSLFPSEGVDAPASWTGVGWSDHWSFWQQHDPAIMITDTAIFRYPYYHTTRDTIDKVNFDHAARVVDGVRHIVETLANEP